MEVSNQRMRHQTYVQQYLIKPKVIRQNTMWQDIKSGKVSCLMFAVCSSGLCILSRQFDHMVFCCSKSQPSSNSSVSAMQLLRPCSTYSIRLSCLGSVGRGSALNGPALLNLCFASILRACGSSSQTETHVEMSRMTHAGSWQLIVWHAVSAIQPLDQQRRKIPPR